MTKREEFIVLLDNDIIEPSDVIIILEGDAFARYEKAVALYREGIASKICFSGGFDDEKSGAYSYEKIKPLLLRAGIPEEDLILEDKSLNTYEQAVEIMNMANRFEWAKITIVASHYHTYRAFLTFLQEQKVKRPELIMDMASVRDLDWTEETGYGRRIDLLSLEMDKIDAYREKGNVASYEEGVEYLLWKYEKRKK